MWVGTLYTALNAAVYAPQRDILSPMRLPISGIFRIKVPETALEATQGQNDGVFGRLP